MPNDPSSHASRRPSLPALKTTAIGPHSIHGPVLVSHIIIRRQQLAILVAPEVAGQPLIRPLVGGDGSRVHNEIAVSVSHRFDQLAVNNRGVAVVVSAAGLRPPC